MIYEKIFSELQNKRVRYLVIGGVAVNLHGFSRATGDLDIMISYEKENLEKFIDVINCLGLKPKIPVKIEDIADPFKREMWIKEKNMKVFSVYNPLNQLELMDIMTENYIDFEDAYKRREEVKIGNIKIPIISIADLIKLKEQAGRLRDNNDICALKSIQELKDENHRQRKK